MSSAYSFSGIAVFTVHVAVTVGVVATTWPLVGRGAELERLGEAIDDPSCGGVVLIGPAGAGKTRLATQALELAALRGLTTRSIRATRSVSAIPFAPLAPLLPQLDLPSEASAGLFRAAAGAISELRGAGRLALMVDDAQDLDDASAALLDQLVGEGSIFVVLTMRASEATADAVLNMWKDERILRLDLAPLGDADVRALATFAVGGPVDGATLQTLVTASAGNVLFLRELIHGALESGTLRRQFGLWRLDGPLTDSPRLRDLIGRRIGRLADTEREALELVALGDPLELSLLTELVPMATIEQLEHRGVLEVTSSEDTTEPRPAHGVTAGVTTTAEEGPQIRLAHPLYGEVVRAALSTMRRARLCRALADAAETCCGSRSGAWTAAAGPGPTR
jgi:predicted ATPase